MKSPSISTYVLTVALAGVGGWALSQSLNDEAGPATSAFSAGQFLAGAPYGGQYLASAPAPGQVPVVLNLTTPPSTVTPMVIPQPALPPSFTGTTPPATVSGPRLVAPSARGPQGASASASSYVVTMASPAPATMSGGGSATGSGQAAPMIITASDGSIVYISQQGNLIANTGATSTSGVVALGVQGSDLASGGSSGDNRVSSTTVQPASPAPNDGNAAWQSLVSRSGSGAGSVAVSGFEDHSVSVVGDDQITTYDDSNVFLFRNGDINANTGDTDSSGLNAVDVWDSRVRAGNSGDGEGVEDAGDDREAPAPGGSPEGDLDSAETPAASTDDDDAEQGEDASGATLSGSGATVTDDGESIAVGGSSMVVGADGYDDVSIRAHGNGNITTYDDSNVVIGGTGHVNAQIGDSDTGGTVVMGIHGSDVSGGCEGDLCYTGSNQ